MGKHDQIADRLTQDILRGQYRPGERLPSERDLAVRFDANRGAVREAMKKLEHLGIACIQPGGARVLPLNEASLDIIEPLLDMDKVPNQELVENIMEVMEGLVQVAAESAVTQASDDELQDIRALVQPLYQQQLDQEQFNTARFEMMGAFMAASNNLVCQLIARSLFMRFAPKLEPLTAHFNLDVEAMRTYARQLDTELAKRDMRGIRGVFAAIFQLNRESMDQAFAAYNAAQAAPPSHSPAQAANR